MPRHHKPNEISVDGDIAMMILTRRDGSEIVTIFDAEDVPKVKGHRYRWGVMFEERINNFYVTSVDRVDGKYKIIRLHRLLTNCPEGFVPDHLNHNTLDNRKSNLRVVSQSQNLQNKSGAYRSSRTGVRGVYFHKLVGKWYAKVCLNRKVVFDEPFDTFEEACQEVVKARKKFYKEA